MFWKIGALILVLFLAAATGEATPEIASIEGEVREGAVVTVKGSGFGVLPTRRAMWDSPDESVYGTMVDGATVPVGASYPFQINSFNHPGALKFTTKDKRVGIAAAGFRTQGGRGYLQWPNALGGQRPPVENSEIYASFWFKPDESLDYPNHSSKFIRVWDDANGNGTRVSWTQMHLVYGDSVSWGDWRGQAGAWNYLELHVDAKNKTIRAWTNGHLIHDVRNFEKNGAFSDRGLNIARIGMDGGGNEPPRFESSFSHIHISNSQARVELCASTSRDLCEIVEIQPVSNWQDASVTFKASLGRLPAGTALYLYVVDQHGQVNSRGMPLPVSCASCPAAPRLSVE